MADNPYLSLVPKEKPAAPDEAAGNPYLSLVPKPGAPAAAPVPVLGEVVEPVAQPVAVAAQEPQGSMLEDAALMLRRGAGQATSAVAGLPVNLANLIVENPLQRGVGDVAEALGFDRVPTITEYFGGPRRIPQPEVVRGIQESIARQGAIDTQQTASPDLTAGLAELEQAQGVTDTLGVLWDRPELLGMLGLEQVPQLVMAVPGQKGLTIAGQGVLAGSMNEAQVAAQLAGAVERGEISQDQADQIAADVFAASAGLNVALPYAIPGAQVLERIAANRAAAVPGQGVLRSVAAGGAAEGAQGALSEGGDQLIANLGTGRPALEGVGKAATLGTVIEGALGAAGGGAESLLAPRATPAAPSPAVPPVAASAPDLAPDTTLDELLLRNVPTEPAAPGQAAAAGETPEASARSQAPADPIAALLADPEFSAALEALAGAQAAPSEATAPAVPAGQGGSPAPAGAVSSDLDRALSMDEDAYIKAVNPTGKRSSAEDEIAFSAGDIAAPEGSVERPEFAFTDNQGRPVAVLEAPDGTLYARVNGQDVGLVESSNGETLNQVAKEFQGQGIGRGLIRAQIMRDPMTPAGSFSEAGEAARRSAFRQLRAERGIGRPLGDVAQPEPAKLGYLADQVGWAEQGGRLLRQRQEGDNDITNFEQRSTGDVSGRTKWVPKSDPSGRPSSFWRDRPVRITEAEAVEALRRHDAGESLSKKQQRFVDYAMEYDRNYMAEGEEEAQRMRETGFAPENIQAQDGGARTDMERDADDVARAFDSGARPVDLGEAVPFSRRPGDLFPAPTNREAVEAARRRRDAERDGRTGTGRTDMAAGEGELFAGQRPEQTDIAPESRSTRSASRRQAGDEAPSQLAEDARTDEVLAGARRNVRDLQAMVSPQAKAIREALGPAARNVDLVGSWDDLPADVAARVRPSDQTEGFYDPVTGRVFILVDDQLTPARAAWVAYHEVAGHLGLRGAALKLAQGDRAQAGRDLVAALERARTNPTVQAVADAIAAKNPDYDATRSSEEALAELEAALRTGNYEAIARRYGVEVPAAQRPGLRGTIERVMAAIRRFLRALSGADRLGMSDAEVMRLLEDAWRYAKTAEPGVTGSNAAETVQQSRQAESFYSALAASVASAKGAPKRADSATWKGWMDGAQRRGEFKQAERDWLGVDAWLDGRGTTTREELADFIRANQVQVQEVMLGGPQSVDAAVPDDLSLWLEEQGYDPNDLESSNDWRDVAQSISAFALDAFDDGDQVEFLRLQKLAESATNMAIAVTGGTVTVPTKFSAYQLPGGEDYRELLLTIPEEKDQAFHSNHWKEANVLAHIRFNEREDADGKRVLFIEEIQSDWHQAGRKKGYQGKRPDQARIEEADRSFQESAARGEDAGVWRQNNPEHAAVLLADFGRDSAVPDAPFKGTDEWAMLAFKRMVRWAVDNGFDRIAWTTGEQQAERYDLSKQVDRIAYAKTAAGTFNIEVFRGGENVLNRTGVSESDAEALVGKEIVQKMNDGVGEVNFATGYRELSGLNLKVGGSGMRSFYDKILPSAVNKWAKKFGGKVAQTTIGPKKGGMQFDDADVHALDITPAMRDAVQEGLPLFSRRGFTDGRGQRRIQHNGRNFVERDGDYYLADDSGQPRDFFTVREAEAEAQAVGGEVRQDPPTDGRRTWSVTLPEGVRMAGERDFIVESRRDDQTQTPEFKRWFSGSKVVDANGKPLVVYHGSPDARFMDEDATFMSMTDRFGQRQGIGAFWFAKDRSVSQSYADPTRAFDYQGAEPRVIPSYLKIENPLVIDGQGKSWRDAQLVGRTTDLITKAKQGGHDGIIVRNVRDNYTNGPRVAATDTYVVFDSRQIKSATGNRGTFDPENPSILESRRLTPEQEAAMAKAGMPTDTRSNLQRIRDKLLEGWREIRAVLSDEDALKAGVFDKFHGLKVAEARLGLQDPETSPYIAARLAAGLPSVMESMMLYGAPEWQGGVLEIKAGTKGLLDALKPVEGDLDAWLGWMVGRRAKLLKAQGRENNLSDTDIDALLSLGQGKTAEFQQAAKDYLAIKNAVLDVAEQAGLIDPEARAAWDHAEYIPFYRAENEGAIGPGTRKGLAGQTSGIRTLKGGENALADPLANIVRNFTRLVDASLKNRATLLAVDKLGAPMFTKAPRETEPALVPMSEVKKALRDQGVPESTIQAMPAAALQGIRKMRSIVPPSGEDVVRVMRDGKPEYYRVDDPLVLKALTGFREAPKNAPVKIGMFFKRLLTAGVTTTPEFVAANFLRDSGSAWVISDDRFKPGWDSIKGVATTLANDKTTKDMMMAGATFMGGQYYGGDPDAAAKALRRALRAKGMSSQDIEGFMGTVVTSPIKLWDKWMAFSSAVENANRRAVYDAAIKAGRSKTEAAFLSRDLMDFSMRGDLAWIELASDVLPFFNARLQGLYKLGRRAGTPQGRRAILARGGVITAFSLGLLAWNMAMYADGYDELEEWDKDTYWHIAPGTDRHVRIPKPFELGLVFGTIPERIQRAIENVATGGESGDRPIASMEAALRAITGTLAITPIPQAALPIIEQWANLRFFTGRPIENMGDLQVAPELREEWYTSETAKLLSDIQAQMAPRPLQMSAKRIQHLWEGYTGGLGAYLLDASDAMVRLLQDSPPRPERTLRELPLLGRFARGGAPASSTRYTTEFYDILQKATEVEQSIKEYQLLAGPADEAENREGDRNMERALRLQEDNADLLGEVYYSRRLKGGMGFRGVQRLRKVQRELSSIRQEMADVGMSEAMSAAAKREKMDELTARRNKLARDAVMEVREREKSTR